MKDPRALASVLQALLPEEAQGSDVHAALRVICTAFIRLGIEEKG